MRAARPATFLVPSALGVDPVLFARHGQGAHVEVLRLDDLIGMRGELMVAAPRLRVLAGHGVRARGATPAASPLVAAARSAAAPPGVRPLPPLERFGDLRICKVDGETVLLTAYGVSSRRTYADMGLAAKNSRKPTKPWLLLMAICEEEGRFTWRDFGSYVTAAKVVSCLRIALKRELGCDEDPFEAVGEGQGWRPRFIAKKDPPEDKLRGKRSV